MITGFSYGFHDGAVATIDNNTIVNAFQNERLTRIKNDKRRPFIAVKGKTAFYEKPFIKNTRRWLAGQEWISKKPKHDYYVSHHWSHGAAAYYTRPFQEEPVVVVIDSIGEWDTCSIWYKKKKVWSVGYPYSLGLFYSAITQAIGLKPNEDEYITMGMAAYGEPSINLEYLLETNLHHGIDHKLSASSVDIACSAQRLLETKILEIMLRARKYSSHLCYGGGVALNCVANSKIRNIFDDVWIMPCPGDAGSALGAAAAINDKMLDWKGPYLGTEINSIVNVKEIVDHLLRYKVCGIANGKAEFGPRALGNRSLLADPRYNIKDSINAIKKRQKFRPFAPAILEEFAEKYFDGPKNEYMQYVSKAKHDYSSVTHVDGTARVQVVKKDCVSILRPLLEQWYERTGCPMLLNTSLNIKGEPMVDSRKDAYDFEIRYKVKVF